METTHEENHGLPYAQAFDLLCTHARFTRSWILALLLGQGGKHALSEHQICTKLTALNSYTVRRIRIKSGFWVALNFLGLLRPWRLLIGFRFAKQQSVSRWGPCCRVFKVVAPSFMLTATTAGREVERSTWCHQGGSDMCPAMDAPYRPRNQRTRRLSVPQRLHTKGKAAHRRPALLHYIFPLN
jgi:hypothetical protein